jgi:acyl carrier protein
LERVGATGTVRGEAALRRWLVEYLVTEIGCDRDDVDVDVALNDLGVGSRDAVVLSGDLSELLGLQVSPLELWQHPTIKGLAGFLATCERQPWPKSPGHPDA